MRSGFLSLLAFDDLVGKLLILLRQLGGALLYPSLEDLVRLAQLLVRFRELLRRRNGQRLGYQPDENRFCRNSGTIPPRSGR